MALIHCPECGREISDKSKSCVHCGYPLQTEHTSPSSKKIVLYLDDFLKLHSRAIGIIRDITGLGLAEAIELTKRPSPVTYQDGLTENRAKELAQKFTNAGIIAEICDSSSAISYASYSQDTDMTVCPRCGSIEHYTGERGFSLVTGFVGSGQIMLTCAKCGHRWKPGK